MHRNDKSDDVIAVSQSPEHSEGEAWQSPLLVTGILMRRIKFFLSFVCDLMLVIWILFR
jgi:hypothetical protein